jgi:hypothetical protein
MQLRRGTSWVKANRLSMIFFNICRWIDPFPSRIEWDGHMFTVPSRCLGYWLRKHIAACFRDLGMYFSETGVQWEDVQNKTANVE